MICPWKAEKWAKSEQINSKWAFSRKKGAFGVLILKIQTKAQWQGKVKLRIFLKKGVLLKMPAHSFVSPFAPHLFSYTKPSDIIFE